MANSADGYAPLTEYLAEEKSNLTADLQDLAAQSDPIEPEEIAKESVWVTRLIASNQAEHTSLQRFLANQQINAAELANELKRLQDDSFSRSDDSVLRARINQLKTVYSANTNAIALIEENLELVTQYQRALTARAHRLEVLTLQQHAHQERVQLQEQITQLEAARERLYNSNVILVRQKKAALPVASELLVYNNQRIALMDDELTVLHGQMNCLHAHLDYAKNPDINTLEQLIDTIAYTHKQNARILDSWLKQDALTCHALHHGEVKQSCMNTRDSLRKLQQQLNTTQHTLATELDTQQRLLRKQLASRKSLIDFSWQAWLEVARQIAQMPTHCYVYLASLMASVAAQYATLSRLENSVLIIFECSILLMAYYLRRGLARLSPERVRSRLSAHLYDGFLSLIYRNVPALAFMTLLFATLLFNQVPYAHYRLLMHLVLVWFFTRQLILIARLTLLERVTDSAGHDVTLYYRLKWLLLMGGWSTALMIYCHELPLSFLLQDIFDRVFMLFILAVSCVAWQSRDAVYYVFPAIITSRKPYFRHAIYLLGVLVPLTLLTTALLGLMGYVNLAWTMSRYEAYFLIFVVAYVLLRGVICDVLDLICEWMVSSLHNGWLWVEAVLKPLDKLLRFSVLLGFVVFFLYWVGLLADDKFIAEVDFVAHYPLINFAGVYITLLSLIKFVALLLFFVWATKWSREFCYRWLYARIVDPGVRNSFAVFSQYAVVLFGCFVTLRVLGIDFTGMMVVLGGLAVGMGFGLRDFASNIVGGLMLLIERPVREGDLITIGDHEGRVAHIGIRSMRVSSWDNMEVLVPNAETFNKPFTNWTHQDDIVRTVIPIKVSRADNPVFIQSLIHAVLADIPEILNEPAPQVYLKQIDEALLEFEVRYFINVQLHTRFEIRSKALLAIMSEFQAKGIEPPIPPLAVELKQPNE
jgi:potassium efflux system protein